MGHGEGLNSKINEEPVQLNDSISDRIQEHWRKIRSQHWGKQEVIGRLALNVFEKRPVRNRRSDASVQGVVGTGG